MRHLIAFVMPFLTMVGVARHPIVYKKNRMLLIVDERTDTMTFCYSAMKEPLDLGHKQLSNSRKSIV